MARALALCLVCLAIPALAFGQEIIVPAEAKKDPDFLVQGEYAGEGVWPGSDKTKIGAQVIGLGNHKFRVVVYRGGLPGAGWKRGDDRLFMDGVLAEGLTKLTGKKLPAGRIGKGVVAIGEWKLKRVERKSPTEGAKPPKGAVVLFDGTNVNHFPGATLTDMKTLQAGCNLKGKYKIARMHIELRNSWKPKARGQGRSNSGVYIGGIPEIQVLDSFGLEGKRNECGGFYGRKDPDVNMCFPPLKWQTYDVEFKQPKPDGNILVTVKHNGVVIHKDYDTGKKEAPVRRLHLQSHGNKVQYRNIWIVEVK